jgi:6-phosphogluconolactonase (cycloisomerase 2 family)
LFDDSKGTLDLVSSVKVGHHPSWITFHPEDRSVVFSGLEQSDGEIVELKFDQQGEGKIICRVKSGGKDPCSLLATKDQLLVAHVSPRHNTSSNSRYVLNDISPLSTLLALWELFPSPIQLRTSHLPLRQSSFLVPVRTRLVKKPHTHIKLS